MKVHFIKEQTLISFSEQNSNSTIPIKEFLSKLKNSDWNQPNDIKSTFNSADILGKGTDRVIFNIGGNDYRLICKYHFGKYRITLFVKWIGTHSDYTKLCKEQRQYDIDNY
jgi:mRNA interferase HigB